MTAVTLKKVDEALLTRYTGISIDTGEPPAATPVTVFIEEPSPEEYSERTFPSITFKFISMVYSAERAHTDNEDNEELSVNVGVTPPERRERQIGLPYDLTYSLDTWHQVRVGESRDLLQDAVIEKTPPRGYMPVTDIDSGTENVWVFWDGSLVQLDEVASDIVVYHKSLTLRIPVVLLTIPTEFDKKVVTTLDWKMYSRRVIIQPDGEVTVDSSDDIYDHTMRITESGEEGII